MPLSGMPPLVNTCLCFNVSLMHNGSSFFVARDRPSVTLEQFSFLEKFFNKTQHEERTLAKLVNLNTLHWYCDEPSLPEPPFDMKPKLKHISSSL